MPKYKLNHNIDEQTCLPHYLVHTHRFSSHSIESGLHCITLCILYYVRRKGWKLGAGRSWARAKLQRNLPIKYYQTHRSSSILPIDPPHNPPDQKFHMDLNDRRRVKTTRELGPLWYTRILISDFSVFRTFTSMPINGLNIKI